MANRTVHGQTINPRPCRNDIFLACIDRRLVRSITRRNKQFHTGKSLFIYEIIVAIFTRSNISRIAVLFIRILGTPSIRLLGSFETLSCISSIERLVHTVGHGHHACKVKRSRRALTNHIKLFRVLFWHHITWELERRNLVIHATIGSLHGQHPVQVPLDFGKQIRESSLGRNIPLERIEILREVFIKRKERISRNTRVHDIATIVTSIIPALGGVDGSRLTRRTMELHRSIGMACGQLPLAGILFFQCHRGTLVIIPLKRSLGHIFISLSANLQIRTEHLAAHLDRICTRHIQFREVYQLNTLTTCIPIRTCLRGHRQNSLPRSIGNFNIAAPIGQGEFLGLTGTITNLVDIGRRSRSRSRKREHCYSEGDILL